MIKYYIDGVTHYLIDGVICTEQDYNEMLKTLHDKDEQSGYNDRKAHVYDKWYRYNRNDDGTAYDRGVQRCVKESSKFSAKWHKEDEENFHIIECFKPYD